MAYGQPWHTETEFENASGLKVGSADTDHLTQAEFEEIRGTVDSLILSSIQDGERPYRTLLTRVPGELFPKHTPSLDNSTQTFTLSMATVQSTPPPIVWLNPKGIWSQRFNERNDLAGAAWMVLVAGAWIAGRATPDRSRGWFNFVNALAPALTVFLWVASVWLKAVYGFVPR